MYFAILFIVQEIEINKRISPFYSGQVFLKTPEKATVKYLLTGIDYGDEYQVEIEKNKLASVPKVELIDEWMIGVNSEIVHHSNKINYPELKPDQIDDLIVNFESSLDSEKAKIKSLTISIK